MRTGLSTETLELDELAVTVVVDNATDILSTIPEGVPQLPESAHLFEGASLGTHDGHDMVAVFERLCVACHGYSLLARARRADAVATVLFDVGPSGEVWLGNAARLGIDLSDIAVLFVSHWHGDHTGGIPKVVAAISEARSRIGRPPLLVDVHPHRPDRRGILNSFGAFAMLPAEPTFAEIEAAGGQIGRHAEEHLVASGLFRSSGDIPRVTRYETGLRGHYTWRDGRAGPGDPRRAIPFRVCARSRHDRLLVLLTRRHRECRPRSASASTRPSHRPASRQIPLGRSNGRGPDRSDRRGPVREDRTEDRLPRSLHGLASRCCPRDRVRSWRFHSFRRRVPLHPEARLDVTAKVRMRDDALSIAFALRSIAQRRVTAAPIEPRR